MVYLILILGVLLSLFAFFNIKRENQRKDELPTELPPHFQDAFPANLQHAVDGATLYALKENVEEQLAELSKQKETIMYMMVRVERMLDAQNNKEAQTEIKIVQNQQFQALSEKDLERARFHNEIYTLYDQGMTVDEISKQVRRGKGEVKLVLNLRN